MAKTANITLAKIIFQGFLLGLLIVLLGWGLSLWLGNHSLSFNSIGLIHKQSPSIFVLDFAPFFLAYAFLFFYRRMEFIRMHLENTIEQMEEVISRNLDIAKRIGEGNLDFEIDIPSDDDLGQALLLMRDNLKATYQREAQMSWISRGKEIFNEILRQNMALEELSYELIVNLVNYIGAIQGVFYVFIDEEYAQVYYHNSSENDKIKENILVNFATYAYNRRRYIKQEFRIGEGLVGECAYEKDIIYLKEIPEDYFTISSGLLNEKKPRTLLLFPLVSSDQLQGVIELASFDEELPQRIFQLVEEIRGIIGQTIANVKASQRTTQLLIETNEQKEKLERYQQELEKQIIQTEQARKELEEVNRRLAAEIQEVERTRKRLYALLENASEVIFIYNEEGIITYISPSIKHILGYDANELIGKNGFEIFSPEVNEIIRKAFMKLLSHPNELVTLEYLFSKQGDKEIWLETTGRNLINNPAINGIIFNTRDITVRKIAERAQRMSGQMRALSENSPDLIMRVSHKGKIYYANPIAEVFLNINRRLLVGANISEISINPQIKEIFISSLEKVSKTLKKLQFETEFPIEDKNEKKIVLFNVIPEFNELNELESVLFVAHDITEQKQILNELEKKNKSITESINYARRIQSAIIPDIKLFRKYLPKSIMFYLSRDVVSGDIPWFYVSDNYIYIAAVDCTGHGVPGALLSFIGYFLLNNIVSTHPELNSGEILDLLHAQVRKTLRQDSPDAEARDGMDIALCKIDYSDGKMSFAGAHRPLYYLKANGEFIQYKGTLKAVGGIPRKKRIEPSFANHEINFEPGDKFYIFTDGLPDQIGGPKRAKLKNKGVRELILNNKQVSIFTFYDILKQQFYLWKKDNKQIDDVLFIGVEF